MINIKVCNVIKSDNIQSWGEIRYIIGLHSNCTLVLLLWNTSAFISLLSQMTTPAVPMAALSPIVLMRSAFKKKHQMCRSHHGIALYQLLDT